MKMRSVITTFFTHGVAIAIGFAAGIYYLPILTAPPAPDDAMVASMEARAAYGGTFARDREDSDALHWGEGIVSIGPEAVSFLGKLAPGPDYRLYLSPEFVETEAAFSRLKSQMVEVGPVRTFENFVVPLPADIDPAQYSALIVWCESFGQFISSARYTRR